MVDPLAEAGEGSEVTALTPPSDEGVPLPIIAWNAVCMLGSRTLRSADSAISFEGLRYSPVVGVAAASELGGVGGSDLFIHHAHLGAFGCLSRSSSDSRHPQSCNREQSNGETEKKGERGEF